MRAISSGGKSQFSFSRSQCETASSRPLARVGRAVSLSPAGDARYEFAADVAWAFKRRSGTSKKGGRPRKAARLDVHLDVATWLKIFAFGMIVYGVVEIEKAVLRHRVSSSC